MAIFLIIWQFLDIIKIQKPVRTLRIYSDAPDTHKSQLIWCVRSPMDGPITLFSSGSSGNQRRKQSSSSHANPNLATPPPRPPLPWPPAQPLSLLAHAAAALLARTWRAALPGRGRAPRRPKSGRNLIERTCRQIQVFREIPRSPSVFREIPCSSSVFREIPCSILVDFVGFSVSS